MKLDIRYTIGAVALAFLFRAPGPVNAALVLESEVTGAAINNTSGTAQAIAPDSFTTPVPSTVFSPPGFPTATIVGTGGLGGHGADVDFFLFSTDGGLALFDIDNVTFTFDTRLSLFDSTGTLIAFDDDSLLDDGSLSSADSFIGTISLPSGTYFVAVTPILINPSAISSCIGSASDLTRPDGNTGGVSLTGCTPGNSSFPFSSGVDRGLAYTLHISLENPVSIAELVPVDIKPQSCPNPLNVKSRGELPVAILGTPDLDVTTIDTSTISLQGVSPLRSSLEDVSTPFEPSNGITSESDCTDLGFDGFTDLTLKFDTQEIVAALGDVADGDVLILTLTGNLQDGTPITGEDVVVILKKGRQ
jgi:hypothetical protein